MTAKILDGYAVAKGIEREIADEVQVFKKTYGWAPGIAVVQVGKDPAASWYVRQIKRRFTGVGMRFALHTLEAEAGEETLAACVEELNGDPRTNGIIVQMPLPEHLSEDAVVGMLDPAKDVDGAHPLNAGRLFQEVGDAFLPSPRGHHAFAPAAPAGGMELLRSYGISLKGKSTVVVGQGHVGRPMALLMLLDGATVTLCHIFTKDLAFHTRQGEVLVSAVGKAKLISADMIRPGAVVLDFGTSVVDGKLVGDVDTEAAKQVAGYITPVPGGTGPMTNAMLMRNTLTAAQQQMAESNL
ncbi:MAG: bifunctional 5,10-methylenetetrahydrofolate dehydrogenase/5,10-methenyltetrahydrofolate cyclohydrolase [Chloroflexota bacterium]|nr:bifunctional 5,10-methylenetetrahydrofolate dehydrogenase/5,10-methenyltetrahydrofolate cyclohydrolase [Chloroflexota bacterium]